MALVPYGQYGLAAAITKVVLGTLGSNVLPAAYGVGRAARYLGKMPFMRGGRSYAFGRRRTGRQLGGRRWAGTYRRRSSRKQRTSGKPRAMTRRSRLAFRSANIASLTAAGSKPLVPRTRTLTTRVASSLINSGTTAGDTAAFDCLNWSSAADPSSTTSFTVAGTALNHPEEHEQAISVGFNSSVILSAKYDFDVRWTGAATPETDFIFAWKFGHVNTAAAVLTAGTTTIDLWNEMRMTAGWRWRKFTAILAAGSKFKSARKISVNVPSMIKLWKAHHKDIPVHHSDDNALVQGNMVQPIDDSGVNTTVSALNLFLHIMVFDMEGTALTAGDIRVDVTVTQRVRVIRSAHVTQADMIDEADQVS